MAASFMQPRRRGDDNKLTRAKVERKGWAGAGISHRTARILGARGLPRSKGIGRNGTRLAVLGPLAPGCFAHSPANEGGSCRASGGRRSEGPPRARAAGVGAGAAPSGIPLPPPPLDRHEPKLLLSVTGPAPAGTSLCGMGQLSHAARPGGHVDGFGTRTAVGCPAASQ
jgi:hypothetical protein